MITNETIWIVGASTGIGRSLTEQLLKTGNKVIASARTRSNLEELMEAEGSGNLTIFPCDVTDKLGLKRVSQKIEEKFSGIDRIIINAGICEYFSIEDPDWDMMRRVMEVNYFGAINTVACALPLLQKPTQDKAHIIAIGSMASDVAFPKAQAYGSSKAALQYFFESLRVDLFDENIAVTVVQPGFVETPLTAKNDFPMPFMVSADEAANVIIKKSVGKPLTIRFPIRLSLILGMMKRLPWLWYQFASKQLKTDNI